MRYFALFFLILSNSLTLAQVRWTQLTPASSPSARAHAEMVHVRSRHRTLLFGGIGGGPRSWSLLGDTHVWENGTWTELHPATSPEARFQYSMAYDSRRDRVVLFGGQNGTGLLGDTWEWDGTTWSRVFPPNSPSPRIGHRMVYDAARGLTVLFGGDVTGMTNAVGDTWEYDGITWRERTPSTSPAPRAHHGLAFDERLRLTILFGGTVNNRSEQDTWAWDGIDWTQLSSSSPPPTRAFTPLVYDRDCGKMLVFGGNFGYQNPRGDAWEWSSGVWNQPQVTQSPSARDRHAMAFVESEGRYLMFGGVTATEVSGETWQFSWSTATGIARQPDDISVCAGLEAHFEVLFYPCATSYQWRKNGVPITGATAAAYTIRSAQPSDAAFYDVVIQEGSTVYGSRPARLSVATNIPYGHGLRGTICTPSLAASCPQVGTTPEIYVSGALGGTVGILYFGARPLNLPFAGGTLLASPDVPLIIYLAGGSNQPCVGTLQLPIPIPSSPSLLDQRLYLQGVLVDDGAPEDVALTNGLEIVLG